MLSITARQKKKKNHTTVNEESRQHIVVSSHIARPTVISREESNVTRTSNILSTSSIISSCGSCTGAGSTHRKRGAAEKVKQLVPESELAKRQDTETEMSERWVETERFLTPRHYRKTPALGPLDAKMLTVVSQSLLPFERHQQHQSIPNRCQLVQLDLNHHISQTNAVAAT